VDQNSENEMKYLHKITEPIKIKTSFKCVVQLNHTIFFCENRHAKVNNIYEYFFFPLELVSAAAGHFGAGLNYYINYFIIIFIDFNIKYYKNIINY
jgi:hypothetical protein